MLDSLLELNNKFNLKLSIQDINNVLEFSETDQKNLAHVEESSFEYYKNEFLATKLLVCICNKYLIQYNKISNPLKQSSLKISLISAKQLNTNKTLIECLETLKSISIGSPLFYGPLTQQILKLFHI